MPNKHIKKCSTWYIIGASKVTQTVKKLPAMQDTWVPSLGEGNDYPRQYSCLENPIDRGAWQAAVHGVAKGWTKLSA